MDELTAGFASRISHLMPAAVARVHMDKIYHQSRSGREPFRHLRYNGVGVIESASHIVRRMD